MIIVILNQEGLLLLIFIDLNNPVNLKDIVIDMVAAQIKRIKNLDRYEE